MDIKTYLREEFVLNQPISLQSQIAAIAARRLSLSNAGDFVAHTNPVTATALAPPPPHAVMNNSTTTTTTMGNDLAYKNLNAHRQALQLQQQQQEFIRHLQGK